MHLSFTPYAPTRNAPYAGHQFYFSLLSALAAERPVTVVAPRTEANERAADDRDRPFEVHLTDPMANSYSLVSRIRRTAGFRRMAEHHPVPVIDDGARSRCEQAESFDLQWSESLGLAADLAQYGRPLFAIAYDLFWTTIAAKPGPRLIGRPVAPLRRAAIKREELRGMGRCGMVVVFKAADAERLRRAGYRGRTLVGSPTLEEPAGEPSPATPPNVLFVGAFDRRENYEGASWFLDAVLPLLRSAGVDFHCVFAGSGMPASLAARATALGVEVTGYVRDLDPIYRRATIAIAPLSRHGGLRFKIPQAMKYGLPVVGTSEAFQGLEGAPEGVLPDPADTPEAFAASIRLLLEDEHRRRSLGRAGRDWIEARYSSETTFRDIQQWIRNGIDR